MGIGRAVAWWEVQQLRVLVLSSLLLQGFLFLTASLRRFAIPSWLRTLIWLAYLGSDALAIYALATLFTRRQEAQGSILEVVWAPVLLMHIGGRDSMSAYNVEDNELWTRYVVTAASQVTVAVYAFSKSWAGGDDMLLWAAVLLFAAGILKCCEKPWALKSASVGSLADSSGPAQRTTYEEGEIGSLEAYVQQARASLFKQEDGGPGPGVVASSDPRSGAGAGAGGWLNQLQQALGAWFRPDATPEAAAHLGRPSKLFVDLGSRYSDRLTTLDYFGALDEERSYRLLQKELSSMFDLLYTKGGMYTRGSTGALSWKKVISWCTRVLCKTLPLAAIGLFHGSRREDHSNVDVKITYALFISTAVLEFSTANSMAETWLCGRSSRLASMVSQYSLMGFLVRNKFKEFADKSRCMKGCNSARRITTLVRGHVKGVWKDHVQDAPGYWKLNHTRGQWAVERAGCCSKLELEAIGMSLKRPFDESVLLWHIATALMFHKMEATSANHEAARGCKEISNYMMHLLVVKPEMLMAGTRRDLFRSAYGELQVIVRRRRAAVLMLPAGDQEGAITRTLANAVPEVRETAGFVQDAWKLAEALAGIGNEKKTWDLIEAVWVEMLCFSAGRCRGYLHAKSLGTGGELLTIIWLLLSHMGMESLANRLQRTPSTVDQTATGQDIV